MYEFSGKVIKRDGSTVEFDPTKIKHAIEAANNSVDTDNLSEKEIDELVCLIVKDCNNLLDKHEIHVEEIQDLVERRIAETSHFDVAKEYITYRYTHNLIRQGNTTDEKILSLIDLKNEEAKVENSNKNPVIIATQRDYMAGEVSRDLTNRVLLPKDIVDAHNKGAIHFHDADYFACHSHNCFHSNTNFVTDRGIRSFASCHDDEIVNVLTKDGNWAPATVHMYGKQYMHLVELSNGITSKIIKCTPDHRWILKDGTVTTNLSVGDILYNMSEVIGKEIKDNHALYFGMIIGDDCDTSHNTWIVKNITDDKSDNICDAWCVEEPTTHSFTLESGIVTGNCDLVNLEDMLQNGTVITGTMIERPHSFSTACNIATQIIAQVASNQYGGQSISLTHLAPFVDVSRKKIRKAIIEEMAKVKETTGIEVSNEVIDDITETRLRDEVKRGVQTIQYQVVTLLTTNGQAPFITVYMYLNEANNEQEKADLAMIIEETLIQRKQGVKNEKGVWITPAFPKLIYVLEEDNITEDSKYWYLTTLAAECTAKRLVPDYISEKKMLELKGDVYTPMGCRSFLTPDRFTDNGSLGNIANAGNYDPKKHKYYGRFNQGVVSINLPYVAMEANGDEEKFWPLFDHYLELCHRALQCRHKRLLGTPSDVAPILWQYGALARLKKGEKIDKLLYGGYSTISLGYAGLHECVMRIKNVSHTDPEIGTPFAMKIMQHMNNKCAEWKAAENIDYSLYGTPLESTTYKFAKALKTFGEYPGVTDHGYVTNSYHVHVTEKINAFDKLAFESQFQPLSPGGAISYIEVPDMKDNIPAVLEVIKFIYDNIIYAELNTKSDYCQKCGYDGEIEIIEKDDGTLEWCCPNCGNTDHDTMNVARRSCGYIGTQFWNQGRTEEIRDRVLHL